MVKPTDDPVLEDIQHLSAWQTAGTQRGRTGDTCMEPGTAAISSTQSKKKHHSQYKEKLQEFRQRSPTVED